MDEIEEDEPRDNHYNSKITRLNCNPTDIFGRHYLCPTTRPANLDRCLWNWSVALRGALIVITS